jgi:pimeloyl-ACP methyl ester carboxylesterase
MPKIDVEGIGIAYDIVGQQGKPIAITAGGRLSKDAPGLRELAGELASAGHRVLIWDRVNCGESDISFDGETESLMNAAALAGLLRALDFGPCLLVGGSAGSRVSLLTAIRHPDLVSGLFLLWISGGALSLAGLATHYYYDSALAAVTGGMEKVANLPVWKEQIARNPGNRDRILAQDPKQFVATMQRWAWSFFPKTDAPVPGLGPDELAAISAPVVVLRSGSSDLFHPRETSEALARMIPNAQLQDPPWGEHEWNEISARGPIPNPFKRWPLLAPQIIGLVGLLPDGSDPLSA